jgi:hypothetical protein
MKELIINVEKVSDWTALESFSNLETLIVSGAAVPTPATLLKLRRLGKLMISNPGNIDLSPLAALKQDLKIVLPERSRRSAQVPNVPNISVEWR